MKVTEVDKLIKIIKDKQGITLSEKTAEAIESKMFAMVEDYPVEMWNKKLWMYLDNESKVMNFTQAWMEDHLAYAESSKNWKPYVDAAIKDYCDDNKFHVLENYTNEEGEDCYILVSEKLGNIHGEDWSC